MEDRKSWNVKDDAVLDDLATLMHLTDEEKQAMTEAKGHAQEIAPQMVSAFYERLLNHENTAEYLEEEGMVDHLRKTLENWFIELFSGEYGKAYLESRLKIGKTHFRIGLPVRYPLAMMDLLMEYGQKAAAQCSNAELATNAFRKLAALDMAIFNHAYENTQIKHLTDMVGNERLARRMLTQEK